MRLTALAAAALMTITPAWAQIDRVAIDKSAFSLGTLRPEDGALPRSLWTDTERNSVSDLLVTVPAAYDNPLNLELLRRVLLSPGEGPKDADNALAGQKLLGSAPGSPRRTAPPWWSGTWCSTSTAARSPAPGSRSS